MAKRSAIHIRTWARYITPTRQEVFFFGTAAGDLRFTEAQLPVWIDNGKHLFYGIPGNHWRGFKIADDTRGPVIDPTTMERQISAEGLAAARNYLRVRFPALADAPLAESRVCQYENSADQNFILDHHPEAENPRLESTAYRNASRSPAKEKIGPT